PTRNFWKRRASTSGCGTAWWARKKNKASGKRRLSPSRREAALFVFRGGGGNTESSAEEEPCPPAPSRGEARFSPRSAHRNGHFPSSWKMSGTQRAVGRNRASHFIQSWPSPCPGGAGGGEFGAGGPRRCPPPHAAFRTLCP